MPTSGSDAQVADGRLDQPPPPVGVPDPGRADGDPAAVARVAVNGGADGGASSGCTRLSTRVPTSASRG